MVVANAQRERVATEAGLLDRDGVRAPRLYLEGDGALLRVRQVHREEARIRLEALTRNVWRPGSTCTSWIREPTSCPSTTPMVRPGSRGESETVASSAAGRSAPGYARTGPELHAKLSTMAAVSANDKDSLRFMG